MVRRTFIGAQAMAYFTPYLAALEHTAAIKPIGSECTCVYHLIDCLRYTSREIILLALVQRREFFLDSNMHPKDNEWLHPPDAPRHLLDAFAVRLELIP